VRGYPLITTTGMAAVPGAAHAPNKRASLSGPTIVSSTACAASAINHSTSDVIESLTEGDSARASFRSSRAARCAPAPPRRLMTLNYPSVALSTSFNCHEGMLAHGWLGPVPQQRTAWPQVTVVIRPPDGRVTGRVALGDEEDGTCPHP